MDYRRRPVSLNTPFVKRSTNFTKWAALGLVAMIGFSQWELYQAKYQDDHKWDNLVGQSHGRPAPTQASPPDAAKPPTATSS